MRGKPVAVAGLVVLLVAGVIVGLAVLAAMWLNPVVFVVAAVTAAIVLAARWLAHRRRDGGAHARAIGGGLAAGVAAIGFFGVVATVVFNSTENMATAPRNVAKAEFVVDATLVEDGRDRSWDIITTVTLSTATIERMVEALGYTDTDTKTGGIYVDLHGDALEAAQAAIFAQLDAAGFGLQPTNLGDELAASSNATQAVDPTGWSPGSWLVRSTIRVPEILVGDDLWLLPDEASAVTIHSRCNAFLRVSPSGTTTCTDDREERVIPLDAPGSSERTSVSGSVVPRALRYTPAFVEWSTKGTVGSIAGFLVGLVPTALGDRLKKWVAGLIDRAKGSKPTKPSLTIHAEKRQEDWHIEVASSGWQQDEQVRIQTCEVVDGVQDRVWKEVASLSADVGGNVSHEFEVGLPTTGRGEVRAVGSQTGESISVGFA